MHSLPSGPTSWANLPRGKGVAYAAQESWVQNETIRDNILFGSPYDEERYKKGIPYFHHHFVLYKTDNSYVSSYLSMWIGT